MAWLEESRELDQVSIVGGGHFKWGTREIFLGQLTPELSGPGWRRAIGNGVSKGERVGERDECTPPAASQ